MEQKTYYKSAKDTFIEADRKDAVDNPKCIKYEPHEIEPEPAEIAALKHVCVGVANNTFVVKVEFTEAGENSGIKYEPLDIKPEFVGLDDLSVDVGNIKFEMKVQSTERDNQNDSSDCLRAQFQCDMCRKKGYTTEELITHRYIHTLDTRYTCCMCNFTTYSYKSGLYRHILHDHTKNKPLYGCDICHKAFTRKGTVATHKRIHTGEKRYSCVICHRQFRQNSDLTKHKLIHTGEKHYKCDFCHKRFSRQVSLLRHKRIHPYR